jgi:protein-tyrosine phosphatase
MLDLSWITQTLAIGGSFSPSEAPALAREHGVSAVVDLRGEACDDAQLLARHGIELLHLPTVDLAPVTPAMLDRGVRFVTAHLAAGRRVLVHCTYGIGRSVLLGLCVLVAHGHAPIDALALAKERRACVSPSPAQYDAWAAWLATCQVDRGATWRVPSFEEFRAIAYRHLR